MPQTDEPSVPVPPVALRERDRLGLHGVQRPARSDEIRLSLQPGRRLRHRRVALGEVRERL
ncbi:hypothetical protein ACFY1U_42855 [Streptomyces sp. NPDC001351]|uniref:hypothetical protein n=1 Tax=Streptomyces sp. NPDC001351 TaxID=3364564 RepID=UPI0036965660